MTKCTITDEDFGRYQKRLCILMLFASIPNSLPVLQPLVTQFTPVHYCDVQTIFNVTTAKQAAELNLNQTRDWREELLNLTIPWESDGGEPPTRSRCSMYNMTREDIRDRDTHPNTTYYTISCDQFYYEGEEVSSVTEFNMVCAKSWQRPLVTAMFMAGMLFSGICCGFLSDSFGRRITFLVFTFLQFMIVFLSSLAPNVTFHSILTFLSGTVTLANFVSGMLLVTEFLPPRLRSFGYFSIEIGYSIGSMLFPLTAFGLRDWRWYLRVTGGIGILYIPYCWLIDETPLWLVASGRDNEAKEVVRKVAKFNHQSLQEVEELQTSLQASVDKRPGGLCVVIKELAKSCTMLSRCAITFFSWFIVVTSYYSLKLNMNSLSGNRFLNLLYGGLTELGATVLFYLTVETRGRRQSYMGFMTITATFMVIASLVVSYSGALATGLSMVCQLSTSVAFNVIYVYTGELFPTKSRHSMIGLNMIGARLGGFVAPFIIYASEEISSLAPSLITAAAIAVTVLTYAFLPETMNKELPRTVKEAEQLPGGLRVRICCKTEESRKVTTKEVEEEL